MLGGCYHLFSGQTLVINLRGISVRAASALCMKEGQQVAMCLREQHLLGMHVCPSCREKCNHDLLSNNSHYLSVTKVII